MELLTKFKIKTLLIITLSALVTARELPRNVSRRFPSGFSFGIATSAYQIEGGWNADGKGENIWDRFVHTNKSYIRDKSNGDIAVNSYSLYKRDVEMLKDLGVNHYRFSISWARILPNGLNTTINQKGISYYNNLINELLKNKITPFVTIYHWELPQSLQDRNGWLNDEIADWFGDYARVLYRSFGDRVKYWITINEPRVHCYLGYGSGEHAPGISMQGIGDYLCGRNTLLANAKAWHIYNSEFRATQNGQVGISNDGIWALPSTNSTDDAAAVADYMDFTFGQFMNPIFSSEGNYPANMIRRVELASQQQGFVESRLRPFTTEQINYIKGTADFLGLNHYSTYLIYRNNSVANLHPIPSTQNDGFYGTYQNSSWTPTQSDWIREYPKGFHSLLVYIKNTYSTRNIPIYITENGMSTTSGLNDDGRVRFHRQYLDAVLDAIDDGVNIQGYAAWSLMDNFEWDYGYTMKFGLYRVNFDSSSRTRTARKSALVYKDIIRTRSINYTYNPDVPDGAFSNNGAGFFVILLAAITIITGKL